ncbi:MAG: right-handed parallel beta-helix repeat-containing protein, partial [Victivallales bacterium]|nr:right-handed parallel beta-helix repeat-containing protein [Victivallales bacterium]
DMTKCYGVKVANNLFSDATNRSIKISGGGDNTIENNVITDVQAQFMGGGILLSATKNNKVIDNQFRTCSIALRFDGGGSTENVIKNNKFESTNRKVFIAERNSRKKMPVKEAEALLGKNIVEK